MAKSNDATKFIVYSIIGAVIFMLVYTFWTNPSIVTKNIKSFKPPQQSKTALENLHPSHKECLNEINQRGDLWVKKSSSSAFYQIVDSEHFNSSERSLNYLDVWSFQNLKFIYGQYTTNKTDITIAIVKIGNNQGSISYPFLCINGQLNAISEFFSSITA